MKIVHKEDLQQISFLDERFYLDEKTGGYYPSVNTILDVYPKGYGYIQWLKDLGSDSEKVMERAAEQGSKIHDAIDKYLAGEEIKWIEGEKDNYTLDEWLMILKFVDFYKTFKPEVIAHEVSLVSPKLGFGGTIDMVCKLNGEYWIIDYKSGNSIYKNNKIQISAYKELWNESKEEKVTRIGCLHLKSMTRGADKTGKQIQGEGWKLDEAEDPDHLFSLFKHTQVIWKEENPNPKPKNLVYPDTIKL